MSFQMDPRLLVDAFEICDLELSKLVVKADKEVPWFILIPRKMNASELIDLNSEEQSILMEEISLVSEFLKEYYRPYKINVANLGNVVRQLHIHVIGRYEDDRAWPQPIWNTPVSHYRDVVELNNIKSNFLDFYL